MNEALFFASVAVTYGACTALYRIFGKSALFAWAAFAAVFANIEVVKTIELFTFETTLGNVLFATTFFATDILSECHGRKEALRCVYTSAAIMLVFTLLSRFTLAFTPAPNDFAHPHLASLLALTPRIVIASLALYFLSSLLDVALYHRLWRWTGEGSARFLWLRNNVATIVSQAVQQLVFAFAVFYGVEGYSTAVIVEIGLVTTVVMAVIALLDTPFLYLARRRPCP